jgi:hypothetical protein
MTDHPCRLSRRSVNSAATKRSANVPGCSSTLLSPNNFRRSVGISQMIYSASFHAGSSPTSMFDSATPPYHANFLVELYQQTGSPWGQQPRSCLKTAPPFILETFANFSRSNAFASCPHPRRFIDRVQLRPHDP